MLPNNATMQSTHTCTLNIREFLAKATRAYIFKELVSESLLSIRKLCDVGCPVYFTKNKLYIFHKRKLIMQGTLQQNKLWTIDRPPSLLRTVDSLVDALTMVERIKFYHVSLFSPTMKILEQTIRLGFLVTFPTLTTKRLRV